MNTDEETVHLRLLGLIRELGTERRQALAEVKRLRELCDALDGATVGQPEAS